MTPVFALSDLASTTFLADMAYLNSFIKPSYMVVVGIVIVIGLAGFIIRKLQHTTSN